MTPAGCPKYVAQLVTPGVGASKIAPHRGVFTERNRDHVVRVDIFCESITDRLLTHLL